MKMNVKKVILLCIFLFTEEGLSLDETTSLIVSSTEPSQQQNETEIGETNYNGAPRIYSLDIKTNITNRFATTVVKSNVKNHDSTARETTFSVILPEKAFISEFFMEIKGKIYKAYVKEKEEAKQIYDQAVSRGQSAGIVAMNPRDSNTFTVSVNVEPATKAIFSLKYEELLVRQYGHYELVLNVFPGQIVKDLNIEVLIYESRPLTSVETPSLRTGNEISKNEDKLKPEASIEVVNETSAIVKFTPGPEKQKEFASLLGTDKENGLAGQFVVQYDVERDPQGGEVLVQDGYFVHFFAPTELKPLSKQVVFVLDNSGSMMGRKFKQLVSAMKNILSDLNPEDIFDIVRFDTVVSVWNVDSGAFQTLDIKNKEYGHLEPQLRELNLPPSVTVSEDSIKKAKAAVKDSGYMGVTNIIEGLEVGIFLITRAQQLLNQKYQPILVFLTDGQPNAGISDTNKIIEIVTGLNSGDKRTSIFSLSFGEDADKNFLQKLSLKNLGFSRHIYEAADASIQLQNFYKQISSPLLNNITFKYVDEVTEVTKTYHPLYFRGSEIAICGTFKHDFNHPPEVSGWAFNGPRIFRPQIEKSVSSLERLWAYLTVKEILEERETAENKTEVTKKALDLALKYSFVTSVSSLVVVKPNETVSGTAENQPRRPKAWQSMQSHLIPPVNAPPLNIYSSRSLSGAPGVPALGYRPVSFSSFMRFGSPRYASHPIRGSMQLAKNSVSHYTTTHRPQIPRFPQWLQDLKDNNGNVTAPEGIFILGKVGDVTVLPDCPKTPISQDKGKCMLVIDCPDVFHLLPDINTYLQYFCPLENKYAGVCCPRHIASSVP